MTYVGLLCLFGGITIYEIYILIRNTNVFCFIFYFLIIQQLSRGFSAAYLDQGAFNLELGNYTWNAYAGPLYFIYLSIFLLFINIFISIANKIILDKQHDYIPMLRNDLRVSLLNTAGLFFIVYLAIDMFISGIPLLSSGIITRFNYWNDYSRLPAASLVSSLLAVICVGFGLNLGSGAMGKKGRNLEIGIIVMMFVERVMLGYRVSGITDLAVGLVVGYLYRKFAILRPSRRTIIKVGQLVIVVIIVAFITYIITTIISNPEISLTDIWQKFLERQLVLSGHMEWAVFSDPASQSWGINDSAELLSVLRGGSEMSAHYGVYGMMAEFAPVDLYNLYFEDGVRYATSFITASLFYNGICVTLLIIIINAFIYAMFYYCFRVMSITNHILVFALLYRVYIIFNSYINASGTLTSFYRTNVAVLIVGCVALWFIENYIQSFRARKMCRVLLDEI